MSVGKTLRWVQTLWRRKGKRRKEVKERSQSCLPPMGGFPLSNRWLCPPSPSPPFFGEMGVVLPFGQMVKAQGTHTHTHTDIYTHTAQDHVQTMHRQGSERERVSVRECERGSLERERERERKSAPDMSPPPFPHPQLSQMPECVYAPNAMKDTLCRCILPLPSPQPPSLTPSSFPFLLSH